MSVDANITFFASVYSSHRGSDRTSTSLTFHCLRPSPARDMTRLSCSSRLTENQNLNSRSPSLISISSNMTVSRRKRSVSAGVQKPITGSTTALLYQERSKKTISPADGRCAT